MEQSLAAQAGALNEFALPEMFSAPAAPMVSREWAPYIMFASSKRADEWKKLGPNPREGEMYFVDGDKAIHLPVAKLGWFCGIQYWAHKMQGPPFDLVEASFTEQPKPFKENVESVVLLYLEDLCVPCNMGWRSTKCPGAKALSDAAIASVTPEWGQTSPAHAETLICPQPFARFYGECQIGSSRTSKSTGNLYRPMECEIKPTSIPEWRLIKAMTEDPDIKDALRNAERRYKERLANVNAKVR